MLKTEDQVQNSQKRAEYNDVKKIVLNPNELEFHLAPEERPLPSDEGSYRRLIPTQFQLQSQSRQSNEGSTYLLETKIDHAPP